MKIYLLIKPILFILLNYLHACYFFKKQKTNKPASVWDETSYLQIFDHQYSTSQN